jgi:hypothetical protein
VDSILDFASKRKRPIAVFVATIVAMAGAGWVAAPSGEPKSAFERAVDAVGKVWPCAKIFDPKTAISLSCSWRMTYVTATSRGC